MRTFRLQGNPWDAALPGNKGSFISEGKE